VATAPAQKPNRRPERLSCRESYRFGSSRSAVKIALAIIFIIENKRK
jgi:hypothetical protein